MFQPTNRNIKTLIPMPDANICFGGIEPVRHEWFADDIDCNGMPWRWRADGVKDTVQSYHGKRTGYVIVRGGNIVRHGLTANGRRGRVRVYPFAWQAAIDAEDGI